MMGVLHLYEVGHVLSVKTGTGYLAQICFVAYKISSLINPITPCDFIELFLTYRFQVYHLIIGYMYVFPKMMTIVSFS